MHVSLASNRDKVDLVEMFHRLGLHYFGDRAASREALGPYVDRALFGPSPGVQAALAREAGTPVGLATFAILYPAPGLSGQLFMKDLFVVQEARGLGVGKAILAFLAAHALRNGCSRLDWTAETDNPGAVDFYRHLGIPEVKEKVYFRLSGDRLKGLAGE